MLDDQSLLRGLRDGDPQALTTIFESYADRLYRLALGLLGDPYEAEDIVQEAFLKAITHIDSFQGRSNIGTWLYRVAYNGSLDRLRGRTDEPFPEDDPGEESPFPMPEVFSEWHTPERLVIGGEGSLVLDEAIQSLPESLRSVFVLRDVEQLSTAETAEVLGINENLVKVRLHRARLTLRERLSVYFVERMVDKG